MTERISPELVAAQTVDDFKQVNGIGPAVEKRLHAAGIVNYAQLARTKPKKLASLLTSLVGFSAERIITQDWIGQARRLAADAGETILEGKGVNSHDRLHYAVFTVELLLDKENRVRRTRVLHVQGQEEDTWAGWVGEKLLGFFVESGHLRISEVSEALKEEVEGPIQVLEPVLVPEPKLDQTASKVSNVPEIKEIQLLSSEGEQLKRMIPGDYSFDVRLLLDLTGIEIPPGEHLGYEAVLYSKEVGSHERLILGRAESSIPPAESSVIGIQSQPLPPGDYHLEALVTLWLVSRPRRPENQLLAFKESLPIHIY